MPFLTFLMLTSIKFASDLLHIVHEHRSLGPGLGCLKDFFTRFHQIFFPELQ